MEQIPTEREIELVIKNANSLKSPGLGRMPVLFYKKYWNIIKGNFIQSVQIVFKYGYILKGWNTTFITFIPKKKNSKTFADFRPVSLTNTCYKVISKLISIKLKTVKCDGTQLSSLLTLS